MAVGDKEVEPDLAEKVAGLGMRNREEQKGGQPT